MFGWFRRKRSYSLRRKQEMLQANLDHILKAFQRLESEIEALRYVSGLPEYWVGKCGGGLLYSVHSREKLLERGYELKTVTNHGDEVWVKTKECEGSKDEV